MRLQNRFSKKQSELAAKIANDIHEGINCGESQSTLRMVVDYWSCVATDLQNDLSIQRSGKTIRLLEKVNDRLRD